MTERQTVLVSLRADGGLQVELPATNGGLRLVPLRDTDASPIGDTLTRILLGLARDERAIGTEGAPTQAQVRHWERHAIWPDDKCAFCRAEAQAKGILQCMDASGVQVTKIGKGKRAPAVMKTTKMAEELGL